MMEYKRIMLFAWDDYEGRGGLNDVIATFDTAAQADDYLMNELVKNSWERHECFCVFDRETGEKITCIG